MPLTHTRIDFVSIYRGLQQVQSSMFLTFATTIGLGLLLGVIAIVAFDMFSNFRRMNRLGRASK